MNFYKHHIGDYAAAIAHLTFVEDAAFSRLLRIYYRDEKPLPVDVASVIRLSGARDKAERDAVKTVLGEFFSLQDDGWHSKRADEEITKAQSQADTNRRIAEEREARKRSTNRARTEHESCNESWRSREPSQTPDSRHQTPDKIGVTESSTESTTVAPADGTGPPGGGGSLAEPLTRPMLKAGIRCNPGHPDIIALQAAGCTEAKVSAAIAEARRARGPGASITQGYVVAILKRWHAEPVHAMSQSHGPPAGLPQFGRAGNETAAAAQRWMEKTG